jgi:transposase-like protein
MMSATAELAIAGDVEVSDKAARRQFTAKYKQEILQKADACKQSGEIGALLRSEGLYSSHLTTWRKARERGELAGLAPKKRGRKPSPPDPRDRELTDLRRQLARATARAERAEALVEVQKKLAQLLGTTFESEKP